MSHHSNDHRLVKKKTMRVIVILSIFLAFSGCSSDYNWGWYAISPFNEVAFTSTEVCT